MGRPEHARGLRRRARKAPDSIVLLDVSRPSEAKVVRTLWNRSTGPDVFARWPLISPSTGDCFFIGDEGNKRTLYALSPGGGPRGRLSALEVGGPKLSGLSLSPDGRYLLFASDRLDPNSASLDPDVDRNPSAREVDRLAEALEAQPATVRFAPWRGDAALHERPGRGTNLADRRPVGVRPALHEIPDWSRDGRRIVFHIQPRKNDWSNSRLVTIENRRRTAGFPRLSGRDVARPSRPTIRPSPSCSFPARCPVRRRGSG